MKNPLKSFDDILIRFINQTLRNRFFDFFLYHVTYLAGPGFLTAASILGLIFTRGETRLMVTEGVIGLLFSGAIVQVLKRIFSRSRPYWILKELNTFGIDLTDYSFPSGHTTAAFSLGTALALNYPDYAGYFILVAFIIAISRIYLAVHYPTDVVAGMLIGIGSALFIHWKIFPMVCTRLPW